MKKSILVLGFILSSSVGFAQSASRCAVNAAKYAEAVVKVGLREGAEVTSQATPQESADTGVEVFKVVVKTSAAQSIPLTVTLDSDRCTGISVVFDEQ